jgi:MFS family permease
MAADLGAIVGPVLAGVLAEVAGYPAAFAVTGAVAAVAFVFWVRAPETLPTSSTPKAAEESLPECAVTECPSTRRTVT